MVTPRIEINQEDGSLVMHFRQPADTEVMVQGMWMMKALQVFQDRNAGQRRGVWKRSGIKGQIVHVFAKAERAFQAAFGKQEVPDEDHLLDLINYSVFALRLGCDIDGETIENPLNGLWPW